MDESELAIRKQLEGAQAKRKGLRQELDTLATRDEGLQK